MMISTTTRAVVMIMKIIIVIMLFNSCLLMCRLNNQVANNMNSTTCTHIQWNSDILCRYKRVFLQPGSVLLMVSSEGFNWYYRISDVIEEVSPKPISLKPGSTVKKDKYNTSTKI